jgi:transcription termination factor Rho
MIKAKKRKQQHGCDVVKLIDAIERIATTAVKIYRAVEPIAKTILTNGRKTK